MCRKWVCRVHVRATGFRSAHNYTPAKFDDQIPSGPTPGMMINFQS